MTKRNTPGNCAAGTQSLDKVNSGLDRVREIARRDKRVKFNALLHHIDLAQLRSSFEQLNRRSLPGVDGLRWKEYQQDLLKRLTDLHSRLHRGQYRAQPSKRMRIPKEDGTERLIGISVVEDKIVQHAVSQVLNAIYEEEFVGFSYGFRPKRNQHQALDAVNVGLTTRTIEWVVDLDIQCYFDRIQHDWLLRFLEHRVSDKRVTRLIRQWLKAGVMDEGQWQTTESGSPQGAVISPLLANIYLHYVFDLWMQQRRVREIRGESIMVRFADDIVLGFEHNQEAEEIVAELPKRLDKFGLKLHPGKTRLVEFGRNAATRRKQAGQGKPETFDFLGFTHIASTTRRGRYAIRRKTIAKRQRKKLHKLKGELRRRYHQSIPEIGRWLRQVLQGYYRYFAVPYNINSLNRFRYYLCRLWWRALRRRSQKARNGMDWEKFNRIAKEWLPMPQVQHPWPNERFGRQHSR